MVDKTPVAADFDVPELPVAHGGAGSAQAAIAEVAALEMRHPGAGALAELLADDARVNRPFAERGIGRDASAALLVADGETAFMPLRRAASSAGDMVFSMGEARDRHAGADRLRYYARIWQHRREGWRIVFDEIVPRRG